MAYAASPFKTIAQEQEQLQQAPGTPKTLASNAPLGGGTSAATGAPRPVLAPGAGAARPGGSGGFVNLNKYLDANQTQAVGMGGELAGNISERGALARNAIGQANTAFDKASTEGQARYDANLVQSLVDNPTTTGAQRDLFARNLSGEYRGPQNLTQVDDYKTAAEKAVAAQEAAKLGETSSGRLELLRQQGRPISQGGLNLNQLLIQNVKPAFEKVSTALGDVSKVKDEFTGALTTSAQKAKAAQEASLKAAEQTRSHVTGAIAAQEAAFQRQLEEKRAQEAARQEAIRRALAALSGYDPNARPQEPATPLTVTPTPTAPPGTVPLTSATGPDGTPGRTGNWVVDRRMEAILNQSNQQNATPTPAPAPAPAPSTMVRSPTTTTPYRSTSKFGMFNDVIADESYGAEPQMATIQRAPMRTAAVSGDEPYVAPAPVTASAPAPAAPAPAAAEPYTGPASIDPDTAFTAPASTLLNTPAAPTTQYDQWGALPPGFDPNDPANAEIMRLRNENMAARTPQDFAEWQTFAPRTAPQWSAQGSAPEGYTGGGYKDGDTWHFQDNYGNTLASIPYSEFVSKYLDPNTQQIRTDVPDVNGVPIWQYQGLQDQIRKANLQDEAMRAARESPGASVNTGNGTGNWMYDPVSGQYKNWGATGDQSYAYKNESAAPIRFNEVPQDVLTRFTGGMPWSEYAARFGGTGNIPAGAEGAKQYLMHQLRGSAGIDQEYLDSVGIITTASGTGYDSDKLRASGYQYGPGGWTKNGMNPFEMAQDIAMRKAYGLIQTATPPAATATPQAATAQSYPAGGSYDLMTQKLAAAGGDFDKMMENIRAEQAMATTQANRGVATADPNSPKQQLLMGSGIGGVVSNAIRTATGMVRGAQAQTPAVSPKEAGDPISAAVASLRQLGVDEATIRSMVAQNIEARKYGGGVNYLDYLKAPSTDAYTLGNTMTPEQIARYNALNSLIGKAPGLSIAPGSAAPSLSFDAAAINATLAQQVQAGRGAEEQRIAAARLAEQQQEAARQQAALTQQSINSAQSAQQAAQNAAEQQSRFASAGAGAVAGAAIGSVVPVIGTAVGAVIGGIVGFFCFAAGAKVLMIDGSYKNIEDLKLWDETLLGGKVLSIGQAFTNDLWFLDGNKVTGGHVFLDEDGVWKRVFQCPRAKKLNGEKAIVYPITTEHGIYIVDDSVQADYQEVPHYADLEAYNFTDAQRVEWLNKNVPRTVTIHAAKEFLKVEMSKSLMEE